VDCVMSGYLFSPFNPLQFKLAFWGNHPCPITAIDVCRNLVFRDLVLGLIVANNHGPAIELSDKIIFQVHFDGFDFLFEILIACAHSNPFDHVT